MIRKELILPVYSLRFGVPNLGPEDELEWANHIGRLDLAKMFSKEVKPISGKVFFRNKSRRHAVDFLCFFYVAPFCVQMAPCPVPISAKPSYFETTIRGPHKGLRGHLNSGKWANHISRLDMSKMSANKVKPRSGKMLFRNKSRRHAVDFLCFYVTPFCVQLDPWSEPISAKRSFFETTNIGTKKGLRGHLNSGKMS